MHPEMWQKEMDKFVAQAMDGQNVQIMVGETKIEVQVASSEKSHKAGLALHDHLPYSGMLFLYQKDNTAPFTRKEMSFEIDIRFYDSAGELIAVNSSNETVAECEEPYRYVLETAPMLIDGRLEIIAF